MNPSRQRGEPRRSPRRGGVRLSWVVLGVLAAAFLGAWAFYGSHLFTLLGRIGLSVV